MSGAKDFMFNTGIAIGGTLLHQEIYGEMNVAITVAVGVVSIIIVRGVCFIADRKNS